MTRNIQEQLKDIEIALLQLQRSALIDTQTIMQLMIDKGICDTEDIVNTRAKIENESEDISRIDEQIVASGGEVTKTPLSTSVANKEDMKKQLRELLQQLGELT